MTTIRTEEQTLVVQVIPPPRASNRDISAFETAAQSLALRCTAPGGPGNRPHRAGPTFYPACHLASCA